jgi:hypothetical protein
MNLNYRDGLEYVYRFLGDLAMLSPGCQDEDEDRDDCCDCDACYQRRRLDDAKMSVLACWQRFTGTSVGELLTQQIKKG